MKYSDVIADWLLRLGYTHCFYVAGGNIMHLLDSLNRRLDCRPVIHEVAAGIAAEYFNETTPAVNGGRALALVTAGPGLTNIVTALAGAYLESRELLVIGGQVKTEDLARGALRQRGIQEIDGVALARPVSVEARLIDDPIDFAAFARLVSRSRVPRMGPVFLEIPIDVQARSVSSEVPPTAVPMLPALPMIDVSTVRGVADRIRSAKRPMFLLGGGIKRSVALDVSESLTVVGIPTATTWNGADRLGASHPVYVGRPNTWGQRSANMILQQADLVVALGTRLGMQQTGFNWQQFVPNGAVIQVDVDAAELEKGHPKVDLALHGDANDVLRRLLAQKLGKHDEWLLYTRAIRAGLPLIEEGNGTSANHLSPFDFIDRLSDICTADDVIIPCSSGGAFTVMMQVFRQQAGQTIVTNKGLASMGYGLAGAIGAAFANPKKRVVLVEGDGGFAQNIQEVGTAAINKLSVKMFLLDNAGYASIRMTQRSYFHGHYAGCDRGTGLGLPEWEALFSAWSVPTLRLDASFPNNARFEELFDAVGPAAFVVPVDPEQTYFPKITSRLTATGSMQSNPLHEMTPALDREIQRRFGRYL